VVWSFNLKALFPLSSNDPLRAVRHKIYAHADFLNECSTPEGSVTHEAHVCVSNTAVHHEFRDCVFYTAFATDAKQLAEEILKQAKALADNIISVEQLAEGNWSLNAAAQGQFVPS
jgi:hypothetical protein